VSQPQSKPVAGSGEPGPPKPHHGEPAPPSEPFPGRIRRVETGAAWWPWLLTVLAIVAVIALLTVSR